MQDKVYTILVNTDLRDRARVLDFLRTDIKVVLNKLRGAGHMAHADTMLTCTFLKILKRDLRTLRPEQLIIESIPGNNGDPEYVIARTMGIITFVANMPMVTVSAEQELRLPVFQYLG